MIGGIAFRELSVRKRGVGDADSAPPTVEKARDRTKAETKAL